MTCFSLILYMVRSDYRLGLRGDLGQFANLAIKDTLFLVSVLSLWWMEHSLPCNLLIAKPDVKQVMELLEENWLGFGPRLFAGGEVLTWLKL